MTATAEIATIETRAMTRSDDEWSVERIVEQTRKIQECMAKVMIRDEHYGVIPGTQGRDGKPPKPTLLKPGAEKLCLMFRFDPQYEVMKAEETPTRISYMVRCTLYHSPTGNRVASGLGSCNSREEKYVRPAPKRCPKCSKETIFKSKQDSGGWYCWNKKGGCGAQYKDGDETIEKQDAGIKDPADLANTLLKMACKRALVAAVLNGTAASDCFSQDLEDLSEKAAEYIPPANANGGAAPPPKESGSSVQHAATQTRGTGAPTTTTGATTTNTASSPATSDKRPRADQIPHDGNLATADKIKLLHVLKSKLQLSDCDGSCVKEVQKFNKKAGKALPAIVRCLYHTQLAAFKDEDGKPCLSSKDLSQKQISNLIDRYKAKVASQAVRADEGMELPPTPTLGGALDKAFSLSNYDEQVAWLNSLFEVRSAQELTPDQVNTAMALLEVYNTPAYDQRETTARSMGKVR